MNTNSWLKYYLGPTTPTMLIRIGPMGSGKTSAINLFIESMLHYSKYVFPLIDLDKIVTTSKEWKDGLTKAPTNPNAKTFFLDKLWNETNEKINGYQIVNEIMNQMVTNKRHISTESTGSFFCPNRKKIIESYKHGYDSLVIFIFLPYFELKSRVDARAIREERDVVEKSLEENILNALVKSNENLYITNNFYFLDNLVNPGQVPNLLLHTKMDFDKKDHNDCINVVESNNNRIDELIELIHNKRPSYNTTERFKIFNEEINFLTKLKSLGDTQTHALNHSQTNGKYLKKKIISNPFYKIPDKKKSSDIIYMQNVNELKYRANVSDQEREAYLALIPASIREQNINYIDDLSGHDFSNIQVSASTDWIRMPNEGEPLGLYVQPDPYDPDGKFGDPTAVGFRLNKSSNDEDQGLNRKEANAKIYKNKQTSNSQGLYGIYGALGENIYFWDMYNNIKFIMQFNDVSNMGLRVGIMTEGHPLRWQPSTDGRDEMYDIILSDNTFKLTPKSFSKIGDYWFSPIARLVRKQRIHAYGKKYLKNADYERLYVKYKTKYLNLKKQLDMN